MSIKYPLPDPHTIPIEDIIKTLESDGDKGISNIEAENRTKEFGPNAYKTQKQKSIGKMILEQFKSPIVYILLGGTLVSVYFKDYAEAIAIVTVIFINAMIGFFMELQARSSMNALKQMDIIQSKVVRESKTEEIPSEKLTPGDIILLEAGDVVPGDGRIIESTQLQCDESALTGESLPSEKNNSTLPKETALGDQHNMIFKGASVTNGNGKAILTGISENTQIGTITSLVEKSKETETPLDKKLRNLSKRLILITLCMTILFAVTGFIQGKKWIIILKTSIALAVAAIPEGLPIVATVALAYGMVLMARRNAIVKKLASVETLGSTNVILTDKTGTLTENKIHVETFSFPEEEIKIKIENNALRFDNKEPENNQENFEKIKFIGTLCNNVQIKKENNEDKLSGDPVEIALMYFSKAAGIDIEQTRKNHPRIGEVPFNSDIKIMGTAHKTGDHEFVAAKGSVEHLLEKCTRIQLGDSIQDLNEDFKKNIITQSEKLATEGLRVLAFAYKEEPTLNQDDFLNNLIYVGNIGFLDPPRLDIKDAILSCRKAGIKVIMITGDHPMTALNIAKKTGLVDENDQKVVTGKDLPEGENISDDWKKKILETSIFARATPKQKLDIAEIYQKENHIVAMTGDGVNDAPALKKADVGIAMGQRGTQVAKETASIVLKDDSFVSITEAISHGRAIFQNIQKFVIYLVSCNLSEILVVTVLGFFTHSITLLPLQILFLNMVTDVFPALALGLGKGDEAVMNKPPRDPQKELITNKKWGIIVLYAIAMTLAVISATLYCQYIEHTSDQIINNIAFTTLALTQLFHVFNMSSMNSGLFVNDITKNKFVWLAILICLVLLVIIFWVPALREILSLTMLPIRIWLVLGLISLLPVLLVQAYKFFCHIKSRKT